METGESKSRTAGGNSGRRRILFAAAAASAICAAAPHSAHAEGAVAQPGAISVQEVIVTAQKRQENVQNVGMSIQAATGDRLKKLGITDTADLQKIIPGVICTPTNSGTSVFTMRGVGFQDTSLAGSPTVSVYLDEAPIPYSALTNGATLDLQRVEVLKGPQGTLFGENATGGAINYIANKPTDHFEAGADLTYGRFNNADIQGFVSGPIADGLSVRLAVRHDESGAWQKSYGPQQGQSTGGQDFTNGRLSIQWKPNDSFKALLTLNGWQDKGFNQAAQLYGIAEDSPFGAIALSPAIRNFPAAPHNDQAADFNQCVNTSPFDPIANQEAGTLFPTNNPKFPGVMESAGLGSVAQAGGQPTSCVPSRRNNSYYSGSLRMEYQLPGDMTATSITEYQKFDRFSAVDQAGMNLQDAQTIQGGTISSVYQEIRLAGRFGGKGNWVVGANYEHDDTFDEFLLSFGASSIDPTIFAYLAPGVNPGIPGGVGPVEFVLGPTHPVDIQRTDTYGVYADGEYPILENLTVQGGVRFTQENKLGEVCGEDGGDGTANYITYVLQQVLGSTNPVLAPPGTCGSLGPASANFNPPLNGALLGSRLDENNVSWRVGLNWKYDPNTLLYVNVSKGYKGGSFPTISLVTASQAHPVVQDALQAYEAGFKTRLFDHQLTFDGAGFYYDYTNKQILGELSDVVFGALPSLVNVPKSHVVGFELSAIWTPDFARGLTITPTVSYQHTQVDKSSKNACTPTAAQSDPSIPGYVKCIPGHYYGFDSFGEYADFTGEKFPSAPEFQASVDAEYDWRLSDNIKAFVGLGVTYTSATNTSFVNRNPTPAFINLSPSTNPPVFGGYLGANGLPSATPVGPLATNHPNDPLAVPGYALLDLRAGIETDRWRFQVWGRNVTNQWYWTAAYRATDSLVRYTGMPTTYGFTLSYRYK